MKKGIGIGIEDFKQMIREDCYYFDKTNYIEELLKDRTMIRLFTRPRRFGKTLNMTTLKYFFDVRNAEENRKLFKEIHKVAYIMAQPVDSFEMNTYKNVESYKNRFEDSYKYLKDYVDIWEIGNEVNGEEWIKENPKFTVKKFILPMNLSKVKMVLLL